MSKEIYSELFDIVADELKTNDKELKFSKESYIYMTECSPTAIDVLDLLDCTDNKIGRAHV